MRKKVITNRIGVKNLIILTFCFILSVQVFAQNVRNTDYKADQSLKSNARVNPSTLAMELSLPIGGYAGRGGNGLPIVFNYSSKLWQIKPLRSWESSYGVKTDTRPSYAKRSAAGWTSNLSVPRIDYDTDIYEGLHSGVAYEGQIHADYIPIDPDPTPSDYPLFYVKRVQVQMPDDSTHEFRADDRTIQCGLNRYGCTPDLTGTFLSVDGSKMRLELASAQSILYMPDGSRYLFGAKTSEHLAYAFVDRNGNRMEYDAANRRWTDTLGKVANDPMPMNWNFRQNQAVGDQTAAFPSINGGAMNVTFSWRPLKDPNGGESGLEDTSQPLHNLSNVGCQGNVNRQLTTPYLFGNPELSVTRVCHPIGFQGLNWWAGPPFNPIVLTGISLPNGQKYEFRYNVYGEITKIIYPTGAYERFLYGYVAPLQATDASYDQANRGVIERWVSARGDGMDELHWTYQAIGQYQQPHKIKTTAPDGTATEQYLLPDSLSGQNPYGFGDAKTGRSYEDRVLSSTNQLLRRHLTGYEWTGAQAGGYAGATRDVRPNREISIIFEPGSSYALAQMSETIYDTNPDPQYFAELNARQTKIYKYKVLDATTARTANIGTIALLFSGSDVETVTEVDYLYDANYKARNINGLAIATRIRDASGNIKAISQIGYDEPSFPILNYGGASGWEDPNTNYRGNPTTSRSWTDVAANQYVETHAQYDNFGNVRKSWDARGNVSEIEYSPVYQYAYPTKTISAAPGGNGANTAFETSVEYDYTTGLPTRTIDANGQISTIEYNDPLLRPTRTVAPNGRQTITEYGAGTSPATRYVKVSEQIDANSWKEGYSWYDGLGRAVRTQAVDAQAGDVFVDTEYDQMGRVKRATNPYRAGEAVYWTQSFYDDLSRVVKIRAQDNSEVNTSYELAVSGAQFGTSVTVTDQAGKPRRSITNSLGQLTRVDEPNAGYQLGTISAPAQPTFYEYDTLGNLTRVNQGVQARTFAYDALSRLKTAFNPESGTINYAYDANGNLTAKTDARNITTAYNYDALNRVSTRSYSDGITPNVSYFYDNLPNAKGQMIKVSNGFSTTEYTQFDQMSRVAQSKQTTDGAAYNSSYAYNLAGALIEQTYPSGRVVKSTLDADGDLALVQSKRSGATNFSTYATNFTYTSAGAVSSMQLGNGRWESTQFNERLQPTQIALGTTPNATNLLKLNYEYGKLNWDGSTLAGTNNGNVSKQTINTPNTGNTYGFIATQYYTYDALNRSEIASENLQPNDGSPLINGWRQNYSYDRYGNRRFIITGDSSTTTIPQGCADVVCNPTANPTNNRLDGYTYDGAGNTIVDASGRSFTYDAENKQTEVRDGNNIVVGRYYYDGDGKRVKKVSNTETVIFVYDAGGKLIAEYSNQTNATPQISYLTNDHLGSPRIITDGSGNVTSRRDFQPFGEEVRTWYRVPNLGYAVDDDVRQKFTTYERDNESGLDFAQARMHNYNLGRFTSPDPLAASANPIRPQSWNRYTYSYNNPLRFSDPTGMLAEWVQKDGEVFYDSRVVDQASATEIYGEDATYMANGTKYESSAGNNIELGDYGFFRRNGEILTNGDRAEDALNNQSVDHSGSIVMGGLAISGGLLADDLTGVGIADDPAIPIVMGAAITGALAAKMAYEISKIQAKPPGPDGVQYSLRATASGDYVCFTCSTGTMNLSTGDVWKYGETTNPTGRYTDKELGSMGGLPVRQFNEFSGTQVEVKVAEKVKIYGYFATHGYLPPGNKIFR